MAANLLEERREDAGPDVKRVGRILLLIVTFLMMTRVDVLKRKAIMVMVVLEEIRNNNRKDTFARGVLRKQGNLSSDSGFPNALCFALIQGKD